MTSAKQKAANEQNARLSKGPATPEGKAVVARNAIKHGIFAQDLVISTGDGREEEGDYRSLLLDLIKDLAPIGRMEMLLVEKIAVNYWRLRRLVRHETGEIRKRLDGYREDELDSYYNREFYSRPQPVLNHLNYGDIVSDAQYQEQQSLIMGLEHPGFNLEEERAALDYVLKYRLKKKGAATSKGDFCDAKKYISDLSPQQRGRLRNLILDEAEQLLSEMVEVRRWNERFDRIGRAKSLPQEKDLNNIVKYENSLERSIFRNLAALKTLQENRTREGGGDDEAGRVKLPGPDR